MKQRIKIIFWIANTLLFAKIIYYIFSTASMQEADYQQLERSNQTFHRLFRTASFFRDDEIYLSENYSGANAQYFGEKMQQTKLAYRKKLDSLTKYLKEPEVTQNELISFAKNYRIYLSGLDAAIKKNVWNRDKVIISADWLPKSIIPNVVADVKYSKKPIQELITFPTMIDLQELYFTAIQTFPLRSSNSLFLQPYRLDVFVMPKTNTVLEGEVYETEVFIGQRVCHYIAMDVQNDDTPPYKTSFTSKRISFIAQGTDFDANGISQQYWGAKIIMPTVSGDTTLNVRHYYSIRK